MKAIRLHAKGGPEQLIYEEATTVPGRGEVRIRVNAAGITPTELQWPATFEFLDGSVRLPSIPAHEVAGTIDSLGPEVSGPTVGQADFGLIDFPRDGCAAEYTTGHGYCSKAPFQGLRPGGCRPPFRPDRLAGLT